MEAVNPANGGISSAIKPTIDDATGEVILEKSQKTLADGSTVYAFWIDIPDDTPTGTYTFSLGDGAKLTNYANEERYPDVVSGTLTIVNGEEMPTTTEPPVTDAPPQTNPPQTDPQQTEPPATNPPATQAQPQNSGAKWDIGEVECEAGATVTIPVTVTGNSDGFNSYIAKIKSSVDGLTVKDAAAGAEFANMGVAANSDTLTFGGTDYANKEDVKADGTVFNITFKVPDDAKAGTRYDLSFDSLEVYNKEMVQLVPSTDTGYILIKDTETEFVHETKDTSAEWVIGKVTAKAGETVKVPVTVNGDKDGINSYLVKLTQDAGPKATGATAGSAYAPLAFAENTGALTFGGTSSDKDNVNVKAVDGTVFEVEFQVPQDAKGGTRYNIKFDSIDLENAEMQQLLPKTEDGWIEIEDDYVPSEAGKWIIGHVDDAEPGQTVTIPVTITGDKNGLNSYILKMGYNEPTLVGAENGEAFAGTGFTYNADTKSFAGTNYDKGENLIAKDGAVVFNVQFKVPDDAKAGDVYPLTFDGLEVFDIHMAELTPDKEDGYIKIKDEVETKDAGEWIIGHVDDAEAGQTVTIPVTIKGDQNGLNSYILKMGYNEPTLVDAANGDAFAGIGFTYNADTKSFAGTNSDKGENLIADDAGEAFAPSRCR